MSTRDLLEQETDDSMPFALAFGHMAEEFRANILLSEPRLRLGFLVVVGYFPWKPRKLHNDWVRK